MRAPRNWRLVELEPGALVAFVVEAPVEECVLPVARALDAFQKLLRDDLIGVDVGPVEHRDPSFDPRDRLHAVTASAASARDVDEVPVESRRSRHLRADEVGAAATALAALEVAVGRGGAALARCEHVGVHAEAHRAAGEAPLEARLEEDLVEPFRLRLEAYLCRSGDDERCDARIDGAAPHDRRGGAEILDPGVRAGADVRSPLRPGPGGSPEPSFGRKLFIEAQASIRVPSTEKWSHDRSRFTSLSPISAPRNSRATSAARAGRGCA